MAAIDYQSLLDTLLAVGQDAEQEEKVNALNNVVTTLQEQEPDAQFATRAMITKLTLGAVAPDVDLGQWLEDELRYFENELEKKIADQHDQNNEDVEMAMGGRKKRRGKKSRKVKKNRRYTRRR